MKQSKLMSWLETCLNTAIGFAIAITAQILVFPLFGFSPPLSTNLKIGLIFTVVSIVRGYVLRRVFEFFHIRRPLSAFVMAAIAERFRQIEQEGWSPSHDDQHDPGELALAGAAYAQIAKVHLTHPHETLEWDRAFWMPNYWPWALEWWKPTGFRRDLVKACALVIAEGEKFDRNRKRKG